MRDPVGDLGYAPGVRGLWGTTGSQVPRSKSMEGAEQSSAPVAQWYLASRCVPRIGYVGPNA